MPRAVSEPRACSDFLDEGHEVVGFDLLPAAIEHECYRHLIVDAREPDSFPGELEPQVIVNVAGTQDSADDIAANLCGTINVTERYAFVGVGVLPPSRRRLLHPWSMWGRRAGIRDRSFPPMLPARAALSPTPRTFANRLAPQAIANSVDPGGVITPLNRCVMEDEHLWSQIMELTPLKRWATAQEIAEWIYFVGVTNRFMTGQSLLIDGGEAGRTQFIWPE